jgi:predicted alpha/beta superfamily hydrolase
VDASTPIRDASTGTELRIHYPAGSHTITLRGGLAPLDWTTGAVLTDAGDDTWTLRIPALSGPLEFKPLLDDMTWAVGPNYHAVPGQTLDVYPHFVNTMGQVTRFIPSFHSTILNNDRVIWAYLPPSYTENTVATYPVVYMHDGQNLWAAFPDAAFASTWNVDTAFDAASNTGTCSSGGVVGWGAQPLGGTPVTCNADMDCPSSGGAAGQCRTFPEAIVIGVSNEGADRVYEYTPTVDPSEADAGLGAQGGADEYLDMLVTELKPQIDSMLRTRPDVASTAMCGSSLGGLVTAYAGVTHPQTYGMIAALSPSTWWDSDVIVTDVMGTMPAPNRPLTVYVDSGQGTVDDEADTDMLAAAYVSLGYVSEVNFRHVIQPGAQHSEVYWAERFPGAMQLVLGPR